MEWQWSHYWTSIYKQACLHWKLRIHQTLLNLMFSIVFCSASKRKGEESEISKWHQKLILIVVWVCTLTWPQVWFWRRLYQGGSALTRELPEASYAFAVLQAAPFKACLLYFQGADGHREPTTSVAQWLRLQHQGSLLFLYIFCFSVDSVLSLFWNLSFWARSVTLMGWCNRRLSRKWRKRREVK